VDLDKVIETTYFNGRRLKMIQRPHAIDIIILRPHEEAKAKTVSIFSSILSQSAIRIPLFMADKYPSSTIFVCIYSPIIKYR
jgi:hypothetical protein